MLKQGDKCIIVKAAVATPENLGRIVMVSGPLTSPTFNGVFVGLKPDVMIEALGPEKLKIGVVRSGVIQRIEEHFAIPYPSYALRKLPDLKEDEVFVEKEPVIV